MKHKTAKHPVQPRPAACLCDSNGIKGGQNTDAHPGSLIAAPLFAFENHSFTTVKLLRGSEEWEEAEMSAGSWEFI